MPLGIITLEDVLEGKFSTMIFGALLHYHVELIGEEIYDEFDPHDQGAQLSSYIPPESDDNYEVSAPSPPSGSGSLMTIPILKPVPTPAFKGLNFLLPKSVTPIPKEPDGTEGMAEARVLSATTVETTAQDASGQSRMLLQVGEPRSHNLPLDTAPDALPSSAPVNLPVHPEPVLARNKSIPETMFAPAATHTFPHNSRSASPASSLEAILLDRKRRGGTASTSHMHSLSGSSSSSGVPSRVMTPNSNKGKSGFKSSPLGGLEKTGVVVAEAVKKGEDGDLNDGQKDRKAYKSPGDSHY
jgi:metal transporter CNNM